MTTTLPDVAPAQRTAPTGPARWPGVLLYCALAVGYFIVGAVLVLRYNIFEPDAPNRVANAGFALQSRHPHLSAIGFVWNPLPSIVEIPLVWLSQWWPALKHAGLAGVVQSALFMAGAAVVLRRIAIDRGVGRGWQWIAVAAFALHPMIVLYGASGLSEAAQVFSLLWCVRHLMLWCDNGRVGDLALTGIALGIGYLARYEALPAAVGVLVVVAAVSWVRSPRALRRSSTILNVLIAMFPFATAFVAWAVTGWIINDELFATLTSQYGNSSQVAGRLAHAAGHDAGSTWPVIASRLFGMQPLIGVAVAVAVLVAAVRRTAGTVVPVAVVGGTLTFAVVAQANSTTFGWFRFYLLAIPLVICVALACWYRAKWPSAVLLTASLVVAIPFTGRLITDEDVAYGQLESGFVSLVDPVGHPPAEHPARRRLISERTLAQWFDAKDLPPGSVLMDSFLTWGIWLSSTDPRQFVITSDYDFTAALNRPWDFGIRYIVATNPQLNVADAVNRRYGTMWDDGAGIGDLVLSADGPTPDEMFRVYRVTGRPAPPD
ncbi:glycosyltransferase family 39 protein [Mycolicibacterium litorale]|uniref:Glycosyltransferase RgtA/B/C/D-like domain-containing protein n=1 Tax=Mycolicibacterium litorale TaxID=758802 RepID=A0AAD1ILQ3_9MYCO|nr:glycosyltransferase family 39 protein [Mycolicibacterium litorale]MCV7416814.1 glycosyltransferase family 39 protein [Mycolicibacterium litorale]TDY04599.1 dolichyl-phosphate-mannose-protein mannosyltransferase [Mycolicibacterium litorale]BBY18025.1 hypothetical protein MLIT_36170 [Mycolicibacterium litorale]